MINKQSAYSKKWSENNLNAGLCCSCKEKRLDNSIRYCEKHYLFGKSKDHFKTTKLWKELGDLLLSQDSKCALTGTPITLGLNDSLDHIIPTSSTGEKFSKDFSNIRWVTRQVNTVKNNLTDSELIDLLEQIKSHISQITKRKILV